MICRSLPCPKIYFSLVSGGQDFASDSDSNDLDFELETEIEKSPEMKLVTSDSIMKAVLGGVGRSRGVKTPRVLYNLAGREDLSSEDEDSDYDPGDGEVAGTSKGAKKKSLKRNASKRETSDVSSSDVTSSRSETSEADSDFRGSAKSPLRKKRRKELREKRKSDKKRGNSKGNRNTSTMARGKRKSKRLSGRPNGKVSKSKSDDNDIFASESSSDNEIPLNKPVKTGSESASRNRKRDESVVKKPSTSNDVIDGWSDHVRQLPWEVWAKVFQYAATEGGVEFLIRMGTVCRTFRQAVGSPELWNSVDLDTGRVKQKHQTDALEYISDKYMTASQTRHLSVANLTKLYTGTLEVKVLV